MVCPEISCSLAGVGDDDCTTRMSKTPVNAIDSAPRRNHPRFAQYRLFFLSAACVDFPQWRQNIEPSGISLPHEGQCIGAPPCCCRTIYLGVTTARIRVALKTVNGVCQTLRHTLI